MSEYITIPLSKTGKHKGKYEAIIDTIDSDLESHNWMVFKPSNSTSLKYVRRTVRQNGNQKAEQLHRVIMERILGRELLRSEFVDHINSNGLDNRRENLRLATNKQNQQNQRLHVNNTSGYKGVTWRKDANKWSARIWHNGKLLHLGYFDDAEKAHEAYCEAAKRYYQEFANPGE